MENFGNLVEEKDKKVKELQDNIVAVNFNPQSKMGKLLMVKCRTQFQENEKIETRLMKGRCMCKKCTWLCRSLTMLNSKVNLKVNVLSSCFIKYTSVFLLIGARNLFFLLLVLF